jgi:UMF1 family MFS transporter
MPEKPFFSLRLNFLLVGLWWAGFAQLTFAVLPRANRQAAGRTNVFRTGFAEVRKVYAEVKKLGVLKRYLRGFFFYSVGVQTVMTVATLFGSVLLKLDDTKLIVTIVLVQLVAIVGATWMSKLSARYGNIRVLMGVVAFWILICVSAYITAGQAENLRPFHDRIGELQRQKEDLLAKKGQMTPAAFETADANVEGELSRWKHDLQPHQEPIEYSFYLLALGVGLVMGGIQSLSRSTYSKLMPPTKDTASYFSYYDLTEKLAIVIGMFTFGFISQITGSMKNAIIFLILFFILGLGWLFSAQLRQKHEPVPAAA